MIIKNSVIWSVKSLLRVCVVMIGFFQLDTRATPTDVPAASDSVSGVMNGVKLKIPRYYIFGPVVRVGEPRIDIGGAVRNEQENQEIDVFGILLRISNLQPIFTKQDRNDWFSERHETLFMKTWLMISFDKQYHLNLGKDRPDMISEWGPYVLEKNTPFGLMHFESMQTVDDGARDMYGHVEYYYDKSTNTTIFCQTLRKRVRPFDTFETCTQYFFVPKIHVMAGAFYTKKDIFRWQEIEARVMELIDIFSQN